MASPSLARARIMLKIRMKSTIRALIVLTMSAARLTVIAAQDRFPDGTAISLLYLLDYTDNYAERPATANCST